MKAGHHRSAARFAPTNLCPAKPRDEATAHIVVRRFHWAAGVRNVIGCDREGAVYRGRPGLTETKQRHAEETNPEGVRGSADEALTGADVYIGLARPGAVTADGVRRMASDAIVFAMANPMPEVLPEEIEGLAAVVATGRSDYPNQINNVLAFPGIFRGAFDVRASAITERMRSPPETRSQRRSAEAADYIVPSVFNRDVVAAVAAAVARAGEEDGVARRPRESSPSLSR